MILYLFYYFYYFSLFLEYRELDEVMLDLAIAGREDDDEEE